MKPLLIVKCEVRSQVAHGIWNALVIFNIDVLIFHTAPQSLDENVVQCSPSAIPADANSGWFDSVRKLRTGKLDSLITIEDDGCRYLQCSIQRIQAKARI